MNSINDKLITINFLHLLLQYTITHNNKLNITKHKYKILNIIIILNKQIKHKLNNKFIL